MWLVLPVSGSLELASQFTDALAATDIPQQLALRTRADIHRSSFGRRVSSGGQSQGMDRLHATTIVAVQRHGMTALAGDGQVTVGDVVVKHHARKIRRLHQGTVLAGFAGSVADAITLFDKFDGQLERYSGNLRRAAVELAKEWRTDRFLRRLEAQLVVADADSLLLLSGDGEVIEPDDSVIAIGSGGTYALAAARALCLHTTLQADRIARAAMEIAASLCIYTNDAIILDTLVASSANSGSTAGLPQEETDGVAHPAADCQGA